MGAYQLEQVLMASIRLKERQIRHAVVYMLEPGRFRSPRSKGERGQLAPPEVIQSLSPETVPARVFVCHTHPEPLLGTLQPLNTGSRRTAGLGFINHGGTISVNGLLFLNKCSWGHITDTVSGLLGRARYELLTREEISALDGKTNPETVII